MAKQTRSGSGSLAVDMQVNLTPIFSSGRSLVLMIQAVDREINRLMSLPDDSITPVEEVQLVKYESLADALEEAYATATRGHTHRPDYKLLVTDRGDHLDDD